jgi:hypothetical protein
VKTKGFCSGNATHESSESAFFPEAQPPELSLSRVLPAQSQSFFDAIRAGRMVAQFD